MLRFVRNTTLFILLTLLTQIGGLAFLIALIFRRTLLAFLALYAGLSLVTVYAAPLAGRVPLNCFGDGPLQIQNKLYCLLHRHYVVPELKEVLVNTATTVNAAYPGTVTLVLDANFPFWDGFPLLPHLSHDDGKKADLAFYYAKDGAYLPGVARSPIGYFAFQQGPSECPDAWPTMRWDMDILQPLWPDLQLDAARMRAVLAALTADPRLDRLFIEPHLLAELDVSHPKIRFQGCRAARHDDHIHFQIN